MSFWRGLKSVGGAALGLGGAVNPWVGAGLAVGGALLGRRGRGGGGPNPEEQMYRNRYESALTGMRDADQRSLSELESFDPTQGFAEQTQAELAQQDEQFADRYGRHIGGLVGQGRSVSTSGFGLQDTQDLVRQGQQERAAIQARNAAAAGQARAQHLYRTTDFRAGSGNRYMDAVGGRFNTLEAQRLQDAAERRQGRAGLLGGIIGAGGSILAARAGRPRRTSIHGAVNG
jgi:hypothetical protein